MIFVFSAWCAAQAAPFDPWLGEWGLDPSASDDPGERLRASVSDPIVTGGAAGKLSPDGGTQNAGQDTVEEERKHALDDAMDLLAASGGIGLSAGADGLLSVQWTGELPIGVSLERRWVKVKREARPWKVRAWMDGANLVVERRQRATSVAETFLPARAPGESVVVVWVEGPSIDPPVEFRRVYRTVSTSAPPPTPDPG